MKLTMTVLQIMAVTHKHSETPNKPEAAQVALQTANGDSTLSLTVPLDRAGEFVIGSEITVTVGRMN